MRRQIFMSFLNNQYVIKISRMTTKTTTNRGNNQKIRRKVREDSVETIRTIRFSRQKLSVI